MTERPILFSAPMVQAILAGTKTQTRRVVKPQTVYVPAVKDQREGDYLMNTTNAHPVKCPYGYRGDQLWVREAWADATDLFKPETALLYYRADTDHPFAWRPSIHMFRWASRIQLEVTDVRVERLTSINEADAKAEGCSPLVWDGIDGTVADLIDWPLKAVDRPYANDYALLWDSLNGNKPGASWADNPYTWVVEFRRIKP